MSAFRCPKCSAIFATLRSALLAASWLPYLASFGPTIVISYRAIVTTHIPAIITPVKSAHLHPYSANISAHAFTIDANRSTNRAAVHAAYMQTIELSFFKTK